MSLSRFASLLGIACGVMLGSVSFSAHAQPVDNATTTAAEEPVAKPADSSLEAVYQRLRSANAEDMRVLEAREREYARQRDAARERVAQMRARVASLEARGRQMEQEFESNRVKLDDRATLLRDKIGALKELFGLFQQNASDLIGAFVSSPTSLQYPGRDVWLEGFANRMKETTEVSSTQDIRRLWYETLREIQARSEIVSTRARVYSITSQEPARQDVARIGGFEWVATGRQSGYLHWDTARQRLETLPRQPDGPYADEIRQWASSTQEPRLVSVDPTGGVLVGLLLQKPTPPERIQQGGLVGYIILGLGAMALLLGVIKILDIAWISWRVARQQARLQTPLSNNALGRVLLVAQQAGDRDAEFFEITLHDTVAQESERVQRFTVFLAIISAVAPLLGLLGTVVGMINTFQAITLFGTGDPQTMAGGISQALITTVLGLVVAVPAVLLHALVKARGQAVCQILQQYKAHLVGDRLQQMHDTPTENPFQRVNPSLESV